MKKLLKSLVEVALILVLAPVVLVALCVPACRRDGGLVVAWVNSVRGDRVL